MSTTVTRGEMIVMDYTGDTKVIWDASKPDEVENARRTFNDLKKKGYLAYSVKGEKGDPDKQLFSFEPALERIIMSAPLQGG